MQITEFRFGKNVIVESATDIDEFEDRANFVARLLPIESRKYIPRNVQGFFVKRR